jgi:lactate dehydrogenase-like 2-hydroxyacid dehydrogenase
MKPHILINFDGMPARRGLASDFTFVDFPPWGPLPDMSVRAVAEIIVTGQAGLSREQMDALPALGLIHVWGAGYDKIDLAAAREKGILVSYDAGTNSVSVADHAFALLFAVMRNIPKLSVLTKRGNWRKDVQPPPIPTGKRVGIVGMGRIGERIARRAEAFEMKIAYHTRQRRPDLPWRHFQSARELAENVDILIVAAPGGASTHHMIDGDVLKALGPNGFLVNVGRGSIVDTEALVHALETSTIAGAGLDVYEDEPNVPAALSNLDNAVVTPHIAGWAPEVHDAAVSVLRQNIDLFLRGEPLLTPVPVSPHRDS